MFSAALWFDTTSAQDDSDMNSQAIRNETASSERTTRFMPAR
jgi:hypothetical protein